MGVMMLVKTDGTCTTQTLRRPPRLIDIQALVGGYLQEVPLMDHRAVDESSPKTQVVAYCNEEGGGLGLPPNELATKMWRKSSPKYPDTLVGDVVFFWGDAAFMRSL